MIVVPAFAERDQRDEQAVAAVICGAETAPSIHVRQRIYRKRAMIQQCCADKKSPHQHLKSGGIPVRKKMVERVAQSRQNHRQRNRRNHVITLHKHQFGKAL